MSERAVAIYTTDPGGRDAAGLSVAGFGRQSIRNPVANRVLSSYAMVWIERGRGWLETAASGYAKVVAPAVFFLAPGMRHAYGPQTGTAWEERWVLFEGALARALEAQGVIVRNDPCFAVEDNGALMHLFGQLHTEMASETALSRSLAAATTHRLVVQAASSRRAAQAGAVRPADEALTALRTRACETLDISVLARDFGVSSATLRRRCQTAYGVPPKVLQIHTRLDKAKQMLATRDTAIEEVARETGFADPFYFARLFQKYEGCAPSDFRKRHRRT